jgi:hypothetical protein
VRRWRFQLNERYNEGIARHSRRAVSPRLAVPPVHPPSTAVPSVTDAGDVRAVAKSDTQSTWIAVAKRANELVEENDPPRRSVHVITPSATLAKGTCCVLAATVRCGAAATVTRSTIPTQPRRRNCRHQRTQETSSPQRGPEHQHIQTEL